MTIYELIADFPTPWPDCANDEDVLLGWDNDGAIFLPQIYCPSCNTAHNCGIDDPIPEAAALPYNHPLLQQIRRLSVQLNEAAAAVVGHELEKWMVGDTLPSPDDPLGRQCEQAGAISPAAFREIVATLRAMLHLPADRKIGPGARFGLMPIFSCTSSLPDIYFVGEAPPQLVIREPVADALLDAGCRGWEAFAVRVTGVEQFPYAGPNDLLLCELLVTGHAGIPANYDRDKRFVESCATCGYQRSGFSKRPMTITLDETEWDGSDIFRFTDVKGVFVTERVKEIFERNALCGAAFRPTHIPLRQWKVDMGWFTFDTVL
ncbi:MAG TPA: double-CXXCG motif protein [Armatimonadota bacterium]